MNQSGDATDQIIRISIEGVDYAVRIAGASAKATSIYSNLVKSNCENMHFFINYNLNAEVFRSCLEYICINNGGDEV